MELRARLFPFGDATMARLRELAPVEDLDWKSARCAVSLSSLARFLKAGERAKGFGVAGEAVFTRADLESVTHFEAVCRRVVAESGGDFEANRAAIDRAPLLETGIRLPRGLVLSRISLKPNMVGSIGDWTQEYVAGSAVTASLVEARCSGLELLEITSGRTGQPHADFRQIFSGSVLPSALIDCSVERIKSRVAEEDGKLRHLGCLAYPPSALVDRPDFNRTAEPWGGWFGQASWVVRRSVVSLFKARKLRGWDFRPVLFEGTALYASYLDQWQQLSAAVGAVAKSKFEGGRW